MAHQVERDDLVAWLLRHGFERTRQQGQGSGHWYFTHTQSGVKVALPGHGRSDLSKRVVGHVLQALEGLGHDKASVRRQVSEGR